MFPVGRCVRVGMAESRRTAVYNCQGRDLDHTLATHTNARRGHWDAPRPRPSVGEHRARCPSYSIHVILVRPSALLTRAGIYKKYKRIEVNN